MRHTANGGPGTQDLDPYLSPRTLYPSPGTQHPGSRTHRQNLGPETFTWNPGAGILHQGPFTWALGPGTLYVGTRSQYPYVEREAHT